LAKAKNKSSLSDKLSSRLSHKHRKHKLLHNNGGRKLDWTTLTNLKLYKHNRERREKTVNLLNPFLKLSNKDRKNKKFLNDENEEEKDKDNQISNKIGEANKTLVKEDNEIKIDNINNVREMIVINKTSLNPIVEVGNNKVDRDMNKNNLDNKDNNNNDSSHSNKKDSNLVKTTNQRDNLIIKNHSVKLISVHMKLQSYSVDYIHITRTIS